MRYCVEIYEYVCRSVTVEADNTDEALSKAESAKSYKFTKLDFRGEVTQYKAPMTEEEADKRRVERMVRIWKERDDEIRRLRKERKEREEAEMKKKAQGSTPKIVEKKRVAKISRERDRSLGG